MELPDFDLSAITVETLWNNRNISIGDGWTLYMGHELWDPEDDPTNLCDDNVIGRFVNIDTYGARYWFINIYAPGAFNPVQPEDTYISPRPVKGVASIAADPTLDDDRNKQIVAELLERVKAKQWDW